MHKPIKYAEKGLSVAANGAWFLYDKYNSITEQPSFTPNWSDKPRPVFINRYRTAADYVVVGATSTENRKAAEAQREQATKDNQRGLMVRGFRTFDSNR